MNKEELLNNINGYPLDKNQKEIATSNTKYLLVSAGAGSGKTLTIIGKIRYLIEIKKLKEEEIMCISFTNEATNSLKNKLKQNYNYNIPCYTFHKLSLEILKQEKYKIAENDLLEYTIEEYFKGLIDNNNKKRTLKYLKIKHNNKNYIKKYEKIKEKELNDIKTTIKTFINLLKSNDYNEKHIISFIKQENNKQDKALLIIILYVYKTYIQELKSKKEIDFNDMISLATQKVKKDNYHKNIKYIIIDEFQDTSRVRLNLIKEIINKTNANLLAVGDDFQSIYRFTGCDLTIFLNFTYFFKNSEILKIENTYRNSQELINIAGSFIMKNPYQIKKNLKSNKHIKCPIEIIYYKNIANTFTKLIESIYTETKMSILVIGRNNNDVNVITNNSKFTLENDRIIYKDNPSIQITYLTVHRSKGLEESNVIIINLSNKINGFPNQIINNKILKYVTCKDSVYPFDEERRLFYVALTRTKNKVYLLVPNKNESVFVKEIKKHYKKQIKIIKDIK